MRAGFMIRSEVNFTQTIQLLDLDDDSSLTGITSHFLIPHKDRHSNHISLTRSV